MPNALALLLLSLIQSTHLDARLFLAHCRMSDADGSGTEMLPDQVVVIATQMV